MIHWIVSALYAEYVEVQLVCTRLLRGESCAKPVAVVQLGEQQQQQLKLDGPSAEIRRRDEEIARLNGAVRDSRKAPGDGPTAERGQGSGVRTRGVRW